MAFPEIQIFYIEVSVKQTIFVARAGCFNTDPLICSTIHVHRRPADDETIAAGGIMQPALLNEGATGASGRKYE